MRVRLSTLWVFMLLNYLYCDVMGLYDPTVSADLSRDALLAASLLMELPILMILMSRMLRDRPNRWANVMAGGFMAVVQAATLFGGSGPTAYYVFFSAIEIACLLFIVWTAWRWAQPVAAVA
jgi:phosphoglycerol transferase MdoB-like AlkP superfamily enzyme